jgi:hypothetical protein
VKIDIQCGPITASNDIGSSEHQSSFVLSGLNEIYMMLMLKHFDVMVVEHHFNKISVISWQLEEETREQ